MTLTRWLAAGAATGALIAAGAVAVAAQGGAQDETASVQETQTAPEASPAEAPRAAGTPVDQFMTEGRDAFSSTYVPHESGATLIVDATVLDGRGGRIENGDVLIENGRIASVGEDIQAPDGATVIEANGAWVTPGIIDVHSHLGVYPSPSTNSHSDGNEATSPNTAEVWAEHSVWPHDPGFGQALAGGVTALQILPGSANLFGGRSVVLKNVPGRTVQEMKFPDAPYGVKMACGENPKRVYSSRGPATRMGNFAGYRSAWIDAAKYRDDVAEYEEKVAEGDEDVTPPKRNLQNETLAGVLNGEILVHMHCYRGDEMVQVLDMAQEFGYRVASFQHAVEGYKIADYIAETDTCLAMWADWWGFKMEAYDGVRENVPMVHQAGGCAIVHSDSGIGIQRLNQEAAKAWADGRKAGIDISMEEAWQWLSYNPAKSLGLEDETGSLEPGKAADIVIWSDNPFSSYALANQVYIDGALLFDREAGVKPVFDFELGQPKEEMNG